MKELIDFFANFFTSVGSEVRRENLCLEISNVPAGFEKFAGKKSPYYFCFESEVGGYELIGPTHYLVKLMKEFLEGRGETTLLKLDVQFDAKEEIPKMIPFRNCKIKGVSKSHVNDFVFRFSFSTTFQYLNDKEQMINNIYVRGGEVINFDEALVLSEGNKREIMEVDTNKEYEIAKARVKELIQPKVEELSKKLNEQLQKEISRIRVHYKNNLEENNQQRELLVKQMEEAKGEKRKKIQKMLQKLEEDRPKQTEENILIDNETKKHGLSIRNKLINISVIYFPIFNFNLMLSGKTEKIIGVNYDSLKKEILPLFCSTCNTKLDEIILCSSGHLTCRNCGDKCDMCGGVFCKSCNQTKCNFCGRRLCSNCVEICASCKKTFCAHDVQTFDNSGRKMCRKCLKKCAKCGEVIQPGELRDVGGKEICAKCYNTENRKKFVNGLFES